MNTLPTLYPWQHPVWQSMMLMKANSRLPHAFLITGNKGLGKTHLAHVLASSLLCQVSLDLACGKCVNCTLWQTQQHPDYYAITPTLENVRELREKLYTTAQQHGARVVLFSAQTLTLAAANALLLLIEEPPSGVYFIIVSSQVSLLPQTLRSRCQLWHCPTPSSDEATKWLHEQLGSDQNITKALQLTYGSPLAALALLREPQQLTLREHSINQFLAILQGKLSAITVAEAWAKQEATELIAGIQSMLWRLARQALGPKKANVPFPVSHLFWMYQLSLEGHRQLLEIPGLNLQLFWETFLFKICGR